MIPIFSIVGRNSNVGKTTLICNVIKELKSRGYRVATIKRGPAGFEIDHPGKDTWMHAQAGADIVMISSSSKFALIEKTSTEYNLNDMIKRVNNVDIIITEGYKHGDKPKVEVFRKDISIEPLNLDDTTFAIVTDTKLDFSIPQYSFNEIERLVDLIITKFIDNK